jgi:hypothetical protein
MYCNFLRISNASRSVQILQKGKQEDLTEDNTPNKQPLILQAHAPSAPKTRVGDGVDHEMTLIWNSKLLKKI